MILDNLAAKGRLWCFNDDPMIKAHNNIQSDCFKYESRKLAVNRTRRNSGKRIVA